MSAHLWNERAPLFSGCLGPVAMKNYTESFTRHDETRFKECLDSVKKGELQWKRIVDDFSAIGKLEKTFLPYVMFLEAWMGLQWMYLLHSDYLFQN